MRTLVWLANTPGWLKKLVPYCGSLACNLNNQNNCPSWDEMPSLCRLHPAASKWQPKLLNSTAVDTSLNQLNLMTSFNSIKHTVFAIFPHAQIHTGYWRTRNVSRGVGGAEKHVSLNPVNGVTIVAQNASKWGLFDLNQLRVVEGGRAFIPESERKGRVRQYVLAKTTD